LLSERFQNPKWVHLSAGDLLRTERQKSNSVLADEINACISSGKLVASSITCQLLFNAMHEAQSSSNTHFLIDGFPRSQSNVDAWENATAAAKKNTNTSYKVQFILNYECPDETLIGRLLERGKVSGRSDDNITTVQARFETFKSETAPILDYYRTSSEVPVYTIATDKPVEAVYQETIQYFQSF
jgi:UMP-CMP kinase